MENFGAVKYIMAFTCGQFISWTWFWPSLSVRCDTTSPAWRFASVTDILEWWKNNWHWCRIRVTSHRSPIWGEKEVHLTHSKSQNKIHYQIHKWNCKPITSFITMLGSHKFGGFGRDSTCQYPFYCLLLKFY